MLSYSFTEILMSDCVARCGSYNFEQLTLLPLLKPYWLTHNFSPNVSFAFSDSNEDYAYFNIPPFNWSGDSPVHLVLHDPCSYVHLCCGWTIVSI